MNVHELARTVREMFAEGADKKLNLTVMSSASSTAHLGRQLHG